MRPPNDLACPRGAGVGWKLAAMILASCHSGPAAQLNDAATTSASVGGDSGQRETTYVTANVCGDLERRFLLHIDAQLRESDSCGDIPHEFRIAALRLPDHGLATEFEGRDLCRDEGSTDNRIAVQCVTQDGTVAHLRVTRSGDSVDAEGFGGTPIHWTRPSWAHPGIGLRSLLPKGDLEPLRIAWHDDQPSQRCRAKDGGTQARTMRATFRLDGVRGSGACSPGVPWVALARVSLFLDGRKVRDLGEMGNQCGGLEVEHFAALSGIAIESSDDGISRRLAYQLGDRLYFSASADRIDSLELPCGAHVAVGIDARNHPRDGIQHRGAAP